MEDDQHLRDALLTSVSVEVKRADSMEQSLESSTGKHSLKKGEPTWHMFDNLSCDQAEDILRRHGDHGTYLISHFHDPESYGLSIRLNEDESPVYKHYAIGRSGTVYRVEGLPSSFPTLETVVDGLEAKMDGLKLRPIFSKYNCETCDDYSVTMSAEEPPSYSSARKFPKAAQRPLPLIVPIRPTLNRMMRRSSQGGRRYRDGDSEGVSGDSEGEPVHHGCCWKAFHTDPAGAWYKPHKAGCVTGALLVLGWIVFLVLFGWIIALALILVFVLVIFAYILNFFCTGRCEIDEDSDG